jgi:hypothetical protein
MVSVRAGVHARSRTTRAVHGWLTKLDQHQLVGLFPLIWRMTTTQFLIAAFAVLIAGLLLPLPSGVRSGLFLALVALGVLTFLGGGMHYITGLF